MSIKSLDKPTPQQAWVFCSDWFEDHRTVKKSRVLKFYQYWPYSGTAYRHSSDSNFGDLTSWSKSRGQAELFGTPVVARHISGLDLESLARFALSYQPKDSDLHDIIVVREVILVD